MGRLGFILTAVLLVLFCGEIYPQKQWTLEQCIEHAKENNLQVKQQLNAYEQASNNLVAAKLGYIPSVNASMNHNISWGRSVNLNDLQIIENKMSQSSSLNISASVPIFEGMKKQNTVKSNIKLLEIAGVNIEKLKDDIMISVTQAYLQVLLSIEMQKAAQESCASAKEQVDKCRVLVEAGSQPYSSLLEMEAQLANEKVQKVSAENNYRSALLQLAQLLDIKDTDSFQIKEPAIADSDLHMEKEDISTIYSNALSLPDIKGAELALENSKLQYKIQKGNALPTISLSGGYGTYFSDSQDTPYFRQFNNNRNPSVGIGLSIPIFNGWRNNTAIRNARLSVKNAELDLRIASQNLLKDIQQAYNEAVSCFEKYNAAKENLAAAKESFRYTMEKFNAGSVSATDYSVAKANLFKAESEFLQGKYQFIFQTKILNYYKNIPVTL